MLLISLLSDSKPAPSSQHSAAETDQKTIRLCTRQVVWPSRRPRSVSQLTAVSEKWLKAFAQAAHVSMVSLGYCVILVTFLASRTPLLPPSVLLGASEG